MDSDSLTDKRLKIRYQKKEATVRSVIGNYPYLRGSSQLHIAAIDEICGFIRRLLTYDVKYRCSARAYATGTGPKSRTESQGMTRARRTATTVGYFWYGMAHAVRAATTC